MDENNGILPDILNQKIDVLEESIFNLDQKLLHILLLDRTTRKNILWATKDYEFLGNHYAERNHITVDRITGKNSSVIQPRVAKNSSVQSERTKKRAEVFTPSWLCNQQNNLADNQWFGRDNVFNVEVESGWVATTDKIDFSSISLNWKDYVTSKRLEISCGEAPYLVSRYDTVTGEKIAINQRIGILDRKMRVINENATDEEWLEWALIAYQSVYGYEFQGDNLLIARENLFFTFLDYYYGRFNCLPSLESMHEIATIISWNLWQMDGLNYVVPYSCYPIKVGQMSLFDLDDIEEQCPGCESQLHHLHTGKYAKIHDWRSKLTKTYFSLMKKGD